MKTNLMLTSLLMLCFGIASAHAQQKNNIAWNVSPAVQAPPLYQNCVRTLYSYHSLNKKQLKKASYSIENGEIVSYDFVNNTVSISAKSVGNTVLSFKVGEKIVAQKTFEVLPIPSPQLALLGKDKTQLDLYQPLKADSEVELTLIIDAVFATLQPEEAKKIEIEAYEMTLFRKGRTVKSFTKDTTFFSLEDLSPEANDAVQIKVTSIKQPFAAEASKVKLINSRLAFFVK